MAIGVRDTRQRRLVAAALAQFDDFRSVGHYRHFFDVVVLHTDSRLAVDTLTSWAAGWERRGWRRKSGPIKNLDLVKEAWALVQARPAIELRWVKAHAGNRWNEYADSLATAWARDEL